MTVISPKMSLVTGRARVRIGVPSHHLCFFSYTLCSCFSFAGASGRTIRFFLCVFYKLFTSSPTPAILKTLLMNYASAIDLKKKNQRTWI